jgi:hypothetical protein
MLWWLATALLFFWYYLDQHFAAAKHKTSVTEWSWAWAKSWLGAAEPIPLKCLAGEGHPLAATLLLSLKKGLVVIGAEGSEKLNQAHACLYGLVQVGTQSLPLIPDGVTFAGLCQILISGVLIFLFVLAVRNRFRMQ